MSDSNTYAYIPPHRRRSMEESNNNNKNRRRSSQRSRHLHPQQREEEDRRFRRWSVDTATLARTNRTSQQQYQQQQWLSSPHASLFCRRAARTSLHMSSSSSDNHTQAQTVLHTALASQAAYCINLASRSDKWRAFYKKALAVSPFFAQAIQRFEAIPGQHHVATTRAHKAENDKSEHQCAADYRPDKGEQEGAKMIVQCKWDSTKNAKYSPKEEAGIRTMLPGELGCALSHVTLWKQLVKNNNLDYMLILEDDCTFVRQKTKQQQRRQESACDVADLDNGHHHGRTDDDRFAGAFARAWKHLPDDWGIFYLGFSPRGERTYVHGGRQQQQQQQQQHDNEVLSRLSSNNGELQEQRQRQGRNSLTPNTANTPPSSTPLSWRQRQKQADDDNDDDDIELFVPEYGYHTHAYMITRAAAQRLLEHLPVCGPIDVWLADHEWFGIPTYCAVIANEGWKLDNGMYEGIPLVSQERGRNFQSDVSPRPKQSVRTPRRTPRVRRR